ncbi:hypothetical protein GCM10011591_17390 [Nocardia camponoti]|uniref:Uncharacterized protein n=1 Tax=Nocardia camponoti TaxID=1616106 RepID=A0A917QE71_9NOCA|nr:hypothetical protein GCM10011591_17390 [Nocardia camponoti]
MKAGKGELGGARAATRLILRFQHPNRQAGTGRDHRRGQAIRPGPDHYDIGHRRPPFTPTLWFPTYAVGVTVLPPLTLDVRCHTVTAAHQRTAQAPRYGRACD